MNLLELLTFFLKVDEQLPKYEKERIEVHITEFDIHMNPNSSKEDYELQGKYYAKALKHIMKSFKTLRFTDAYSWNAGDKNRHFLMLDENFKSNLC